MVVCVKIGDATILVLNGDDNTVLSRPNEGSQSKIPSALIPKDSLANDVQSVWLELFLPDHATLVEAVVLLRHNLGLLSLKLLEGRPLATKVLLRHRS